MTIRRVLALVCCAFLTVSTISSGMAEIMPDLTTIGEVEQVNASESEPIGESPDADPGASPQETANETQEKTNGAPTGIALDKTGTVSGPLVDQIRNQPRVNIALPAPK